MPQARELKNIAFGLMGWFEGRYNDIEGYWALGILYREAQRGDGVISFDLAGAQVRPSTPVIASMLNSCIARFDQMLAKRGFRRAADVAAASITIAFGTADALSHWSSGGFTDGDPYRCTVSITDRRGRVHTATHVARCRPHDPTRESRSGG